ncbi:interleukin-22 [Scomber japonicus]|uniref:interleukin-22 n=1 Tax=Scomber japonicus TaxID=13676 RepID=UPI002304F002|nr:interleukin-22 [Scomber japonicus]
MKVSTLVSFFRPSAAVLVLLSLLLIGWTEHVTAVPVARSLSAPLQDSATWDAIQNLSQHAQSMQSEEHTNIRLIPRVNVSQDQVKICCLHANILDYYLSNVLHQSDIEHPSMHLLKTNLARVSEDLKRHGCSVTHYHNHHHAVEFRRKLKEMDGDQGIIKAVGEIDILFSYLQDFCIERKN